MRCVLSARVSSVRQEQDGNLARQTERLKETASERGYRRAQAGRNRADLNTARAFYIAFFLAHPDKLTEHVEYFSEKHQAVRERLISPNELLTWAESLTIATREHPRPLSSYNFSSQFPDFPFIYRRSVIKDAIGKVRSYLSNLSNWNASGKKKGQPGNPGASNHPTLYAEAFCLDLDGTDLRPTAHTCFARLKVYTGSQWCWHQYPVKLSRYFEARWRDPSWEAQSPKLILHKESAALHFPQVKHVEAKRVKESKEDPHLVTVAERSNQHLWAHVRRTNEDAARQVAHRITQVCARYPGCVLLFERLRKIRAKGGSKSRRMNRRQANHLRGKINRYTKDKAYATYGVVTVEVNPHGTSQYCSRCGARGERFSFQGGKRLRVKWGKLFACPVCQYEANADYNASVNVHRSFYREWHWQPRTKPPPSPATASG